MAASVEVQKAHWSSASTRVICSPNWVIPLCRRVMWPFTKERNFRWRLSSNLKTRNKLIELLFFFSKDGYISKPTCCCSPQGVPIWRQGPSQHRPRFRFPAHRPRSSSRSPCRTRRSGSCTCSSLCRQASQADRLCGGR